MTLVDRRIERAVELCVEWPFAREILSFYRVLREWQLALEPQLRGTGLEQLAPHLPGYVERVAAAAPAPVAAALHDFQ
ncbi:MAG: hypothetical protein ACRD96_27615, partial [Bryobacteraceae bacterium]